jgi:hypothetical protein
MKQRLIAFVILSSALGVSCGRPEPGAEKDSVVRVAMAKAARAESSSSPRSRGAEKNKLSDEVDSVGPIHDSITVGARKAGNRAHDLAMSLIVARWIRCRHAGGPVVDADSAVADSTSYPSALPAMADLLRGLGKPNERRPEDAFILGWLGREQQDCFDDALPVPPDSLVADAARRDTSNALFRYYRDANKPRGQATDALAEALRRFAGRGEHYRAILDWLREELHGD